jgi:hypothetical protein
MNRFIPLALLPLLWGCLLPLGQLMAGGGPEATPVRPAVSDPIVAQLPILLPSLGEVPNPVTEPGPMLATPAPVILPTAPIAIVTPQPTKVTVVSPAPVSVTSPAPVSTPSSAPIPNTPPSPLPYTFPDPLVRISEATGLPMPIDEPEITPGYRPVMVTEFDPMHEPPPARVGTVPPDMGWGGSTRYGGTTPAHQVQHPNKAKRY